MVIISDKTATRTNEFHHNKFNQYLTKIYYIIDGFYLSIERGQVHQKQQ